MDSVEVLISLLSIVLIVLLLLMIVAMVYVIRLIRRVNHISLTASNVMDDVKTASNVFKNSAGPVAVSKVIANVVEMWRDSTKKGKE